MRKTLLAILLITCMSNKLPSGDIQNKQSLYPGIVACLDLNGVSYSLYGYFPVTPSDLRVCDVSWSGGMVGFGNYGTFYFSPIFGVSNLNFVGPNGPESYSGAVHICVE